MPSYIYFHTPIFRSSDFCSPPYSEAEFFLNRYTSLKISMEQMLYAIFLEWPTNKTVHLGVPKTAEWTTVYLVGREDLGPVNFTTLHPQGVVLEVPRYLHRSCPASGRGLLYFRACYSDWSANENACSRACCPWTDECILTIGALRIFCDIICAITLFVACMGKLLSMYANNNKI